LKKFAAMLVAWGPPGLFILTLLDSAGVPIPGVVDALLIFLASKSPSLWLLFAAIAVTGSVLGSMFLYFLARKGGQRFLDRRTASGRGAHFKAWYLRYGLVTVFIPALSVIPLPMKVAVFCAGALGVRPLTLAGTVFVARTIRYFSLAYLGSLMGDHALTWINQHKWTITAGILAAALLMALLAKIVDQRSYPPPTQS